MGLRTTKCQLLVTSLCVMLLGLSIAILSTVTHYGLHFTLISNISLESNSYRVIHYAAFYFGICLSMTLILAALLSSAATVRESQCLTAMVEDSMMDVYDFVYEEVRRNASNFRRHELTAIHEADCLRKIQDFLKKHTDFVSTLLGITISFMVYGMILTSFLWFSIHFSSNLDRKGKYILRER
ncbi:tetraspanin-32 [Grus japonensis]|uniref:Tetraspanin-32 n=1 Tax=Grus japonensis TaxID=30415 RepID=A0ABC9WXU8_GRUJA